jgi:hypothetical protein
MLTAFALARGVLRARHPPPPPPEEHVDPSRYETGAPGWAELALAALLAACGLCLAGFAVLLMVDADTQLLGATAGAGLACLAAALILAGLRVAPRETTVEHREIAGDPAAVQEDEQLLRAGADGVSRRRRRRSRRSGPARGRSTGRRGGAASRSSTRTTGPWSPTTSRSAPS